MDFSKVTAALVTARKELLAAVQAQRDVVNNQKSTVKDIAGAAKALKSAGAIDTALASAEKRITKVIDRAAGNGKKKKSKKAEAAK